MKLNTNTEKKRTGLWLVILAAVLYVAGAVALFLMMRSAPEVAYHGETYRLTGYAETFSDYTFDFASDSGTTVHGARCLDCGGFVVTDSAGNSAVCGTVQKVDGVYQEQEFDAGACTHEVSGMTQEEAVAFAAGAQRQAVKDGSVWTVTIYWVIVLGVAAFVLYKKRAGSKEQKKRVFGDSIYTIMLVLDLVFALSVIYDVSRL